MTTADTEMTAYIARHGLSGADQDFTLAYGQRRYEEGRDGTRQSVMRLLDQYLADLRAGKIQPLDAKGFAVVVGYAKGC